MTTFNPVDGKVTLTFDIENIKSVGTLTNNVYILPSIPVGVKDNKTIYYITFSGYENCALEQFPDGYMVCEIQNTPGKSNYFKTLTFNLAATLPSGATGSASFAITAHTNAQSNEYNNQGQPSGQKVFNTPQIVHNTLCFQRSGDPTANPILGSEALTLNLDITYTDKNGIEQTCSIRWDPIYPDVGV